MSNTELLKLRERIGQGKIPSDPSLFAAHGLVITEDNNRDLCGYSICVVTPHAKKISWLVHRLAKILRSHLDKCNQDHFFMTIGKAAKETQEVSHDDLKKIATTMIEAAENWALKQASG